MNNLIFINALGTNYRGDNIYEFIFSSSKSAWGEEWESKPANGNPRPPDLEYVSKVGTLNAKSYIFELVQNSDYFSMNDSVEGIIALGWEMDEEIKNRLIFRFGETEENIKNKLYSRDLILEFEKISVYEN